MERYEAITLTSIALFERIVFMLIVEWFPLLLILLCRSLSYENCLCLINVFDSEISIAYG